MDLGHAHLLSRISNDVRDLSLALIQIIEPVIGAKQKKTTSEIMNFILISRKLRSRFLGEDLANEPSWIMLLELMLAGVSQKPMSVTSLCYASDVPSTTALRWIKTLEQKGLITRRPDPADRRRVYVTLTQDAADILGNYLEALTLKI